MRDPEMKWLQQNIGRAKAVLIAPEIVKAGFIIGGSGGRAVLVAKEGGKWVGPAFYTLATASVGFQAGVAVSRDGHARHDGQGHELAARRARSSSAATRALPRVPSAPAPSRTSRPT